MFVRYGYIKSGTFVPWHSDSCTCGFLHIPANTSGVNSGVQKKKPSHFSLISTINVCVNNIPDKIWFGG